MGYSSRREKRDSDLPLGCAKSAKGLVPLIALIISIINALTRFGPSSIDLIVGVEVHTKDSNLVTWYCQAKDGRFYDCTSNKDTTIAANLPQVAGVASDKNGKLILLYLIEKQYWLGDVTGPKTKIALTGEIVDIATNNAGSKIIGLCKGANEMFDCFGDPGQVYKVAFDQHFLGISLDDQASPKLKIWCAAGSKVEECK